MRLTSARASGSLGDEFDALIDRAAAELDQARAKAGGLRGAARQELLDRLTALDAELVRTGAGEARSGNGRLADPRGRIASWPRFRSAMPPDAFARAKEAVIDRLVRERNSLPTIALG